MTGRQDETLAVILTGLDAGARVVTSGFSRLSDGAKARLAEPEGEAGEGGEGGRRSRPGRGSEGPVKEQSKEQRK
jgi:multidrug efflux system membrane fusion protein